MMPEENPLMANRKSSVAAECEAKDDDDDGLLTLSLGVGPVIRRSDAGARRALPDDCLPVTPTLPVPIRPVSVAVAPPPYAIDLPPSSSTGALAPGFAMGLAVSVIHGDGNVVVPAAGALTAASKVAPATTLPLLPQHFSSVVVGTGGSAFAVPVHGGVTPPAAPTPLPGLFVPAVKSPPTNVASSSAPPKKRRRVINRPKADTGGSAAPINGGVLSPAETAPPPFPWAKPDRAAEHYSVAELAARGIHTVEGEVQCKRCDARQTLSLDIRARFAALREFVARNAQAMDDRAPEEWKDPALPDCARCGQKSGLRPVIAADKDRINWVFLLLGQTLGLCTLEQLKHFCAHTNQHRTGAKDRVLYSTYMELCNQLCPGGPFDMASERRNRGRPFA